MNNEPETMRIIAKNIAELRKAGGMTQAGLAEKLGYSDKSISKWERAEGLPDVLCLKRIADLFGVSVDWFFEAEHKTEPHADDIPEADSPGMSAPAKYVTSHTAIALLSVSSVWMLAALAYVIIALCGYSFALPFVIALPVSALLLVIFHGMWGRRDKFRRGVFLTVSLLVWSVLFLVCFICREHDLWLLMVLGFPATVVVALACRVKKKVVEEPDGDTQ